MQYTENYSLRKPQMAETASVSDLNYNSDRIDAILADDRQISVAMYVSGNTYNTGDLVGYENPSTHRIRVYRCLVDNVTGTWDSTKWTLTNLADEILDAKASGGTEVEANPTGTASDTLNTVRIDNVIYAVGGDSANQNIADAFSELQTYAVGDYCIYESILYKCTTAVQTAGAWDSTKWTSCVVTDEMGSGGGGGSSTFAGLSDVSLTSLTDGDFPQYDATAQKWKNVAIAGVNVQPVVYSTEEREIGVWHDGKPLYRRTYTFSTPIIIPYSGAAVETPIDSSDIDVIIYASAIHADGTNYDGIITDPTKSNHTRVGMQTGRNGANATASVVVLEYTKLSDTAGSGTWTPSSVPSVHYSTTEQVVGTWIDGSTLYEKVFTGNVSMPSNSWYDFELDSGINIVMVEYAKYLLSGGGTVDMGWYRSSSIYSCYTITQNIISALQVGIANISGYRFVVRYTKSSS